MNMKQVVIYDENGRIFSSYITDDETNVPSGIPFLTKDISEEITEGDDNYRPLLKVDVSKEPHELVYGLTPEEAKREAFTLEEYKSLKIAESKQKLADYLEQNPITSTAHNGVPGVYAVTEEKQNLMTSNYLTYQIESQINPDAILTWNETGKSCEEWKSEEFLQLVIEIKNFVKPRIAIQQAYEESVMNASSKDDIDLIPLLFDIEMSEDEDMPEDVEDEEIIEEEEPTETTI